jgi:hypothetical protein
LWINPGDRARTFDPALWIDATGFFIQWVIQDLAKTNNSRDTAWWTTIGFFAFGKRLCITAAIRIAALCTLCLRKGVFD